MKDQPRGIAGLTGREPVGAVLTIGVKGPSGAPIEKDRLHIVWPQENAQGIRERHPRFRVFNDAKPERRQIVYGQLVHPSRADCFEFNYRNQFTPGQPAHPGKVPFCVGNGETARRWNGDEFVEMACPGEKCEFRMKKNRPPCKPWMRLLFRLVWNPEGLPTPLTKYTSGSWNTIRNAVGFFDHLERQATALGFVDYSLMGFRLALQLTEKSNAKMKTRFPVLSFTPLDDPIEFFTRQLDHRDRIETHAVAALTDASQTDPDTEAEDWRNHVPGRDAPKDADNG